MADEIDFLVVGLGNPGAEYENTPHNLGFLVIDRLSESHGIRVSRKEEMSLVGLGAIRGEDSGACKAQTYMNLSGPAVKGLLGALWIGQQPARYGVRRARSSVDVFAHQAERLGGRAQGDRKRNSNFRYE